MTEPNDSQLDALLEKHLADKLDGQLGRSAGYFQRMAKFQQELRHDPAASPPPQRLHINRWRIVWVGSAVAAAIAAVMIFSPSARITPGDRMQNGKPQIVYNGSPGPTTDPAGAMDAQTIPVRHEVAWQTTDRGTVFVGDEEQPMRGYVRQRVDNFRWTDPNTNAKFEVSVPNDEVMLVNMNSH